MITEFCDNMNHTHSFDWAALNVFIKYFHVLSTSWCFFFLSEEICVCMWQHVQTPSIYWLLIQYVTVQSFHFPVSGAEFKGHLSPDFPAATVSIFICLDSFNLFYWDVLSVRSAGASCLQEIATSSPWVQQWQSHLLPTQRLCVSTSPFRFCSVFRSLRRRLQTFVTWDRSSLAAWKRPNVTISSEGLSGAAFDSYRSCCGLWVSELFH